MRKTKRILSVVLVWAMLITQNLGAIRPAFANVNNETVGEGVKEDIIIEESTTEEIDAGSHPQEGSSGEAHPYDNADIPETTVGADIIRPEEESQTEENSSGTHPQEGSFGETHPYNINEDTDETSVVLDTTETTVLSDNDETIIMTDNNETTVEADINETIVEADTIRPEEIIAMQNEIAEASGFEVSTQSEIVEASVVEVSTQSEIVETSVVEIATQSEIVEASGVEIATQSEIVETSVVEIATQSEIEIIASPSEIEIIASASEIIEIATLSEITLVATVSEMSAMTFEMQLINQNAKFTKNENEYILDEDLILTDTLHVHEEVVLNLNSHTITAPENGSAIYIENNFTLTGTLNEMSDETDFSQEIRGTNNVYPAVEAKNAKVFLNNGTIRGAEGGAALLVEDSDVEVNGAVLVGGNGASYETRQGDDGGDGVQIIFNDKNHTFKFNYGIIIGGDGGRGIGKIIAAAGAALNIGDSQILSEKLTLGEMGEEGGGNGGNAINILKTKNADDNVIINGMAIAAGNGGKNAEENENEFLVLSAENYPASYDLRDKDGKNYITSLKNQGVTGWCARFTAIAGAETDLIVNYRDYLEKNGYNVEKTLAGEDNPDQIDLSEAHLGIYDQYQAMDVFGNAGLSYSLPPKVNAQDDYDNYIDNGQADPCLSAYLSTWRDIQKEEVKPWADRYNYPKNVAKANKEVASEKPFAVMTNSKIVSFDTKSSDTDEEYKKQQDAFINSIKQSILNGNGAKVGIQVYQKNGWTKSNVEYNGKKYHTFNLSRASFSELSKKNDPALGGHAMYAIGWDDNFPKELFGNYGRNITEDGALLVKNSWGSFTWITYQYAFNNAAANEMEFIPSNDYENIYYYDGGTGYTSYSFNGTEGSDGYKNVYNILANSFVIKNDKEKIRAISYNAATKGVPVDVYIYKADSDTVEGINAATGGIKSMTAFNNAPIFKTTLTFNTGTTFIPVDPPIEAKKDEVYFVMVDYKNSVSTLAYVDESVGNDYTTPANHSYVASRRKTDGSKLLMGTDASFHTVSEWFNLYNKKTGKGNTNLNFRIKLITNNYITLDAGDGYFDADTTKTKDYTYLNIEDQYGDLKKPTSNDPSKEFSHYDFDGTYNSGDAIDVESTTEYVPEYAKAMVLHAIYKDKPTYTITFDAGEGTMPTGQKTLTFYEGEDKKLTEVDYVRDNYKLASWTNQETGAEVALNANVKTFEGKNITLVANWISSSAPSYTITFDANGGTMPTGEKTQSYLEGESTTIIQVDYTRDGYDLTGWVIDGTSTKVSLDANVNTLGNKDITLKAEWTKIPTYTITFETNGGTAPTGKKTMTYIKNEDKQLITVDYVRKGYKLDAWINASDNSIVALDANVNTLGNKDITLKASWLELPKKKYTITYDPGDSAAVMPTGLKTQEFYEGDTGTIINVDYKIENKVINNWKREDTGKDVLLGAKLNTLEGDGYDTIKLIAVWRAASQGVYDKGGNSSSSSGSSSSGSGSSSGGRISAGSIGINETNVVTSAGPGAIDPLQANTNPTLNQNVVTPTITPTITGNEHYVTRASYNPVQGTSEAATTFSNGKWEIDPNTNTWNYKVELEGYGEVKAVGWVNDVAFNAATNANESHKYYFDNDGQMVAGFITDSFGNTYYMDETAGANLGRMVTGPRMIGGYMYYFFDNGVMLKNYEVDGHVVDSEGRFVS